MNPTDSYQRIIKKSKSVWVSCKIIIFKSKLFKSKFNFVRREGSVLEKTDLKTKYTVWTKYTNNANVLKKYKKLELSIW